MGHEPTLQRVETYFDGTATRVWEQLTSDAPVSRIRATVRAGRDRMRATMLDRLPVDLTGARVLDAGCGTGAMCQELARRGADVVGVDISPSLIAIARRRMPEHLGERVRFTAGDMLNADLGGFDHIVAMDSLIYYGARDLANALNALATRCGQVVFTVAPRTPLLLAMWQAGKMFPKADRSPVMVPQSARALSRRVRGNLEKVARVNSGFYIADCLEMRA